MLVQSGLQESWWAEAMECYCYLRNVQDMLAGGQTLYERRFSSPLEWPIIQFRAEVNFFPISSNTMVECISSAQKFSLEDYWIRLERGEELDWWSFDCGYGRSKNNSTI